MAPQPAPPPNDIVVVIVETLKSWWSTVVASLAAFVGLFKIGEIMMTRKIKEVTGIDAIAVTLVSMKTTQERMMSNQELMLGEMAKISERVAFLDGWIEGREKKTAPGAVVVLPSAGPLLHPMD